LLRQLLLPPLLLRDDPLRELTNDAERLLRVMDVSPSLIVPKI
jgi:hypothetical protein